MSRWLLEAIRTPDGWTFPGPHGTSSAASAYGATSSAVSVVASHGEAVVIDTGTHAFGGEQDTLLDAVCRLLERERLTLRSIVLTHWHFDHVGNAARLRERAGGDVVCHRLERPLVEDPEDIASPHHLTDGDVTPEDVAADFGVADPASLPPSSDALRQTWAAYPTVSVDREVTEGAVLTAGEHRLRVIHTPGHTAGHVSLFDETSRSLYLGDVMYWPAPMHPYPLGRANDQLASIETCLRLGAHYLYPGHELPRCGAEDVCDYLRDLATKQRQLRRRIQVVLGRAGPLTVHDLYPECFVVKDRYDPMDVNGIPYGLACLQSHLRALTGDGTVERTVDGPIARWQLS